MMETWKNKSQFKRRVRHWARKLDIDVRSLALRPMINKWASCSTNGQLSFNVELLDLEKDIGDYVIVHELLHFHVPNHGKLWKTLMRAHLGEYEKLEARLKEMAGENGNITTASTRPPGALFFEPDFAVGVCFCSHFASRGD